MKKIYAWALNACFMVMLIVLGLTVYFMPLLKPILLKSMPGITDLFETLQLLLYIFFLALSIQIIFAFLFCIQVIRDAELDVWGIRFMEGINVLCLVEIAIVIVGYAFLQFQGGASIKSSYLILAGFVFLILFFLFGLWAEIMKEKNTYRREVRHHDELEEPTYHKRRVRKLESEDDLQDTIH